MTELDHIAYLIENAHIDEIDQAVSKLLEQGVPTDIILQKGIMVGMQEVGRKFASQKIFLPEMLCAARTAKRLERVFSQYSTQIWRYSQKVLLGTVKNDLHDIGKNLVHIAVENAGFEVVDLGVDVSPDQFVQAAEADEAIAFVGVSALLTTTMQAMRETVKALQCCRAASRLTILVGGAPVTDAFAKKLGAIYTETAFDAAKTMQAITEERFR